MQFPGQWYLFDEAPAGSYACVWAPEGNLEGAKLAWMPASRGQIPRDQRKGVIFPVPEIAMPFRPATDLEDY